MATGAICFAQQDAAFAMEVMEQLNLHTSLRLETAESKAPEDFLDVIEQCLSLQFVIVVLSENSVPRLWRRDLWELVLVNCVRDSGTKVAYVMSGNCPFPPMLRRRSFFDFTVDPQSARRGLRQWVIRGLGERSVPDIGAGEEDGSLLHLVDQPGLVRDVKRSGAEWLVSNYWRDFENAYWVECGGGTRAGVLGETAHALGLRLAGTVEQNLEALRKHAESERALYVFEYLNEEFGELAEMGGRSSVIVLRESHAESVSLAQLNKMFATPQVDEAACLRAMGRFMNVESNPGNWDELKWIGLRASTFFQNAGRMAEAHELLVWLSIQATRNEDVRALKQIQWDETWILDSWNLPGVERAELTQTQPSQMWLALGT